MEGARIVASPEWGWWVVLYFFFGGIAAGAYFMSVLIDLLGHERDRPVARIGYYLAAPLVALCGVLLIVDLHRPERFWHMLIQSNTFFPMIKYWSPMSIGSWVLSAFGLFTGLSFLGALAEEGRFGLGRFGGLARRLHHGPIGVLFELGGVASGFFIASYTGVLLTASNQPFWSDSPLIGALFLASAASTGMSTMLLILAFWRSAPHESVERLEMADTLAMVVELALIVVFFASLGGLAPALLATRFGLVLLVGTVLIGLLLPMALHWQPRLLGRHIPLLAPALGLVGGMALRYAIVMAGQHVAVAGR